jgi:hypothetical protein
MDREVMGIGMFFLLLLLLLAFLVFWKIVFFWRWWWGRWRLIFTSRFLLSAFDIHGGNMGFIMIRYWRWWWWWRLCNFIFLNFFIFFLLWFSNWWYFLRQLGVFNSDIGFNIGWYLFLAISTIFLYFLHFLCHDWQVSDRMSVISVFFQFLGVLDEIFDIFI